MAPVLRTDQTLIRQSGQSYRLQKELYEREEIKKQVWLAWYTFSRHRLPSAPQID